MVLLVDGFSLGLNGFHWAADQLLFGGILLHLAFGLAPGLLLCWANPADAFLRKQEYITCVCVYDIVHLACNDVAASEAGGRAEEADVMAIH